VTSGVEEDASGPWGSFPACGIALGADARRNDGVGGFVAAGMADDLEDRYMSEGKTVRIVGGEVTVGFKAFHTD
jgi:hypothetical protein